MRILLLMFLCHIIDDFVLQSFALSNLKQKEWWEKNYPDKLYKDDYKAALIIHAFSWAIMIHLPVMFMTNVSGLGIAISVAINTLIHAEIDNEKANEKQIDLITDQLTHATQILFTWLCCYGPML